MSSLNTTTAFNFLVLDPVISRHPTPDTTPLPPTPDKKAMGLAYNVYLNSNKIFGCKQCKTHLADYNDIVSRVSTLRPPPQGSGANLMNPELPRPTWKSLPV